MSADAPADAPADAHADAAVDAPAVEDPVNYVNLESNDGHVFKINMKAAKKSTVVANLLECYPIESVEDLVKIPLLKVDGKTLKKIVEYLECHMDKPADSQKRVISEFEKTFFDVSSDELIYVLQASNYLDVRSLTNSVAKEFAKRMRNKTDEEMCAVMNITCDVTAAEKAAIDKEYAWTK